MHRAVVRALALLALFACAGCGAANEARVAVTENGFEPALVTLAKGRPATLVITRTTDATCATEAVFAESGKKYALPLNQPVRIPIEAAAAETLHYACGMDMYQGRVAVR